MDPEQARIQLNLFVDNLPDSVFLPLRDRGADPGLVTTDITSAHEFAIRETGNICEGVLRVLAGKESPSNFVAFIQQDKNIEEDNLPKIAGLAYEIQTKIFDPVLPILKQAGFKIKEGRVAEPPQEKLEAPRQTLQSQSSVGQGSSKLEETTTPGPSLERRGGETQPPLDDKNIRALTRIASGTTYREEQLREAFADLPAGLRNAVASVDTANAIQEIAKKYLLHVDQMGALASETGLVLLGLTHPADFIKNLAGRLRVPEERAKEVARDISGQILSKVREALRTLHESPSSTNNQTPNTKQIPISNTQTEPLRKLKVMPRLGSTTNYPQPTTKPSVSSVGLEAKSLKLEPSSTPYSAGAKWNTGENILSKQAQPPKAAPFAKERTTPGLADSATPFIKGDGDEEPLSRAEVLMGIENPKSIPSIPRPFAPQLPQLKTSNSQLETLVGPTGWKPSVNTIASQASSLPKYPINKLGAAADGGKSEIRNPKSETNSNLKTPENKWQPTSTEKTRPQSESTTPPLSSPLKRGGEEEDFLDQKLQAPMALPKEERRYTSDPYREPLQ